MIELFFFCWINYGNVIIEIAGIITDFVTFNKDYFAQSAGAVEYTNCFSAEG